MTFSYNDAGTWRTISGVQYNDAGTWRTITSLSINDAGTWRTVFNSLTSITAHPTLNTDLTRYYKFENNGNDEKGGTAINSLSYSSATKKLGSYGVTSSSGIGTSASTVAISFPLSINFWCNYASADADAICWGWGKSDTTVAIYVQVNASSNFVGCNYGASSGKLDTWTSASGLTTFQGNWHMVTLVVAADENVKMYVDAVEVSLTKGTIGGGSALPSGTESIYVKGVGPYSPADAYIDEMGWWSKALSASEVSDLYNSGSGLPYS